jgi:hypothetical protein
MRTTVTLDPDTAQIVQQRMRDRGVTFKVALNDLLRERAVLSGPNREFRTATAALGPPRADLDKALQLAAALEDDELRRRLGVDG